MRLILICALALSLVLTACATAKPAATSAPHDMSNPSTEVKMDYKAMDAEMEAGIKAFPAKTEGKGNQLLSYTMDGDYKKFTLDVSKIQWEVTPGVKYPAYAFNGMVPGPIIRVTEGDKVEIVVNNKMTDESTGIHWHGLRLPNDQDGVTFITQPPILPGQSYTYKFTATNPGTHMYHSHHNALYQVGAGLLGAFIVDPKDPAVKNQYGETIDTVLVLNEGALGFTLNGKGFPATEPIVAKVGDRVRIRFLNEGQMIHPMHLHGYDMTVVEEDGNKLPAPYKVDTLLIAPGQRFDVIVDADTPGVWAFHCHILSHAENQHGMFGMVTAFIVNK